MTRFPFWSDDFDMDLLKVLPETPQIMGDLAERTLYTIASNHREGERLNHPCVWNHDLGIVAWFGSRPGGFTPPMCYPSPENHGPGDRVIECTGLEAFRDAWVHSYAMVVDCETIVWDTQRLKRTFDALMWHRRGWATPPLSDDAVQVHLDTLTDSLVEAAARLLAVPSCHDHPMEVETVIQRRPVNDA